MFATNAAAHGAGLAAPQIGVGLAAFVYDCLDAELRRHIGVVCNPVVELPRGRNRHLESWDEGCLSLPGGFAEFARRMSWFVAGRTSTATTSSWPALGSWPAAFSTRPTTSTASSSATDSPADVVGASTRATARSPTCTPSTGPSPRPAVPDPVRSRRRKSPCFGLRDMPHGRLSRIRSSDDQTHGAHPFGLLSQPIVPLVPRAGGQVGSELVHAATDRVGVREHPSGVRRAQVRVEVGLGARVVGLAEAVSAVVRVVPVSPRRSHPGCGRSS